jgi:hypothetical protein
MTLRTEIMAVTMTRAETMAMTLRTMAMTMMTWAEGEVVR